MALATLNQSVPNHSARFRIVRVLGQGSMGVVYEAYDHSRKRAVALKKLRRFQPEYLYRFKREFRTARRIQHPNVISLYELVEADGEWFFTMELVDGQHFINAIGSETSSELDVVRVDPEAERATETLAAFDDDLVPCPAFIDSSNLFSESLPHFAERVDEDKLRSALLQLARALVALHAEGVVHRDVKPSNILVTRDGRVVLTDFSVAADQYRQKPGEGDIRVGTPSFMAPEQMCGEPPTAAADWYAFGTVLYLALAGRVPFVGEYHDVLHHKQHFMPLWPSEFCDGVPGDLEELCLGLLHPRPEHRLRTDEILAMLGDGDNDPDDERALIDESPIFVGRHQEMEHLWRVYEELDAAPRCVLVQGPSGIGKTCFMERFLAELDDYALDELTVFKALCNEREMFPYKAFDGIVEQWIDTIETLPAHLRDAILPADTEALLALFPAFRSVIRRVSTSRLCSDAEELRQRGHRAFRDLVSRFVERYPTVIAIDAMHSADAHSLDLLCDLVRDRLDGRLLVLAAFATDDADCNPGFMEFLGVVATQRRFIHLPLPPLTDDEQGDLLDCYIGDAEITSEDSREICLQAAGHPLLLTEMARHAREHSSGSITVPPVKFDDVLWERVSRLSEFEVSVLELIAAADEPVPAHVLADATGGGLGDVERALGTLSHQQLTRISRSDDDVWPVIYHEAMRQAILDWLSEDEKRAYRQVLERALERWSDEPHPIVERRDPVRPHASPRRWHRCVTSPGTRAPGIRLRGPGITASPRRYVRICARGRGPPRYARSGARSCESARVASIAPAPYRATRHIESCPPLA